MFRCRARDYKSNTIYCKNRARLDDSCQDARLCWVVDSWGFARLGVLMMRLPSARLVLVPER